MQLVELDTVQFNFAAVCTKRASKYVDNNQQNALNPILLYFFLRWLLHVSTKQCHSQGATTFLSEPLQRQFGRRQVTVRVAEPRADVLYSGLRR
jgi:hypothetical protein